MHDTRPMGFRSIKPNAMTNAEKQRAWRSRAVRHANIQFDEVGAAALLYIKKQWGFRTNKEAVLVAVRHLAVETRQGLERIRLEVD